jgi:hypothetical protein
MNKMLFICFALLIPSLAPAQESAHKPEVPVDKWPKKTILLIGAHADDDAMSHGTLAMLQAHGNQIYIVTLTTGNVGTQRPEFVAKSACRDSQARGTGRFDGARHSGRALH